MQEKEYWIVIALVSFRPKISSKVEILLLVDSNNVNLLHLIISQMLLVLVFVSSTGKLF